jgi:hypothetical protein
MTRSENDALSAGSGLPIYCAANGELYCRALGIDEETLEIIFIVAIANFSDTLADALKIEVDEMVADLNQDELLLLDSISTICVYLFTDCTQLNLLMAQWR